MQEESNHSMESESVLNDQKDGLKLAVIEEIADGLESEVNIKSEDDPKLTAIGEIVDEILNGVTIATSNLNPLAEEFYPISEREKETTNDEENRVNNELHRSPSYDHLESILHEINDCMVWYFRQLKKNPAVLDDVLLEMKRKLSKYLTDEYVETLGGIFSDKTLQDAGCAYFSVKLACVMMDEEAETRNSSKLRDYILEDVEKWCSFVVNVVLPNPEEKQENIYALLMFLSELYHQLCIEGSRLTRLAQLLLAVCIVIKNTERLDMAEKLRQIVSVLKLNGRLLEKEDWDTNTLLNTLMGPLWIYADKYRQSIGESVFNLVDEVTELRYTHKWVPPHQETRVVIDEVEECVMFGPDGNIISQEEQEFLDSCVDSTPNTMTGHQTPSERKSSAGEMNDEMYEAFEEFLAETNSMSVNSVPVVTKAVICSTNDNNRSRVSKKRTASAPNPQTDSN